jgi:hypothetical protein
MSCTRTFQTPKFAVSCTHFVTLYVPPKGRIRIDGNEHWKFSKIECREGIIVHAKVSVKSSYKK